MREKREARGEINYYNANNNTALSTITHEYCVREKVRKNHMILTIVRFGKIQKRFLNVVRIL